MFSALVSETIREMEEYVSGIEKTDLEISQIRNCMIPFPCSRK